MYLDLFLLILLVLEARAWLQLGLKLVVGKIIYSKWLALVVGLFILFTFYFNINAIFDSKR